MTQDPGHAGRPRVHSRPRACRQAPCPNLPNDSEPNNQDRSPIVVPKLWPFQKTLGQLACALALADEAFAMRAPRRLRTYLAKIVVLSHSQMGSGTQIQRRACGIRQSFIPNGCFIPNGQLFKSTAAPIWMLEAKPERRVPRMLSQMKRLHRAAQLNL